MGEATRERLRSHAELVWAELFDEPLPQLDDARSWQSYLRTEREAMDLLVDGLLHVVPPLDLLESPARRVAHRDHPQPHGAT